MTIQRLSCVCRTPIKYYLQLFHDTRVAHLPLIQFRLQRDNLGLAQSDPFCSQYPYTACEIESFFETASSDAIGMTSQPVCCSVEGILQHGMARVFDNGHLVTVLYSFPWPGWTWNLLLSLVQGRIRCLNLGFVAPGGLHQFGYCFILGQGYLQSSSNIIPLGERSLT